MTCRTVAIALSWLILGCNKPPQDTQLGLYCQSGSSSRTVGRVHITTATGNKLDPNGFIIGPEETVLYVAVSLPERETGSGGSAGLDAGPTKSTLSEAFRFKSGLSAQVDIEWDRAKDSVRVEGRSFLRASGNVFLIEIDGRGAIKVSQNSKVRSERVPEGDESRVIKEEFPHLARALSVSPFSD